MGISKDMIKSLRKNFSSLCTNPSGVLLETELLKIALTHEYDKSKGNIQLTFTPFKELHHFKVELEEWQSFHREMIGDIGYTLDKEQSLKLIFQVLTPFKDA